jgi:hypothetical protein
MSAGQDWVEQARRLVETFRAGTGSAGSAGTSSASGGAPAADCRWCPLCQAAAVLRGERPEVSAALADVLTATAAALRSFAGEAAGGPGATAGERTAGEETAGEAAAGPDRPAPVVQRIELS